MTGCRFESCLDHSQWCVTLVVECRSGLANPSPELYMFTSLVLISILRPVFSHPLPPGTVAYWGPNNNWPILESALPPRSADWNNDGTVNSQDLYDFLAVWNQQMGGGTK